MERIYCKGTILGWRRRFVVWTWFFVVLPHFSVPTASHGACNVIPRAVEQFESALGASNRPFASPGDFVEIALRRTSTSGMGGTVAAEDLVALFVFSPPAGKKTIVGVGSACVPDALSVCESFPEVYEAACVETPADDIRVRVNEAGLPTAVAVRFPSTDELFDGVVDDRGLTGPVTIAILHKDADGVCELAELSCLESLSSQPQLVACIDEFFENPDRLGGQRDSLFPHFTALPKPNNFAALNEDCDFAVDPQACDVRATVDTEGNLFLPVDWSGILLEGPVPIPRLLEASSPIRAFDDFNGIVDESSSIEIPSQNFIGSFTPEGTRLPPIFEPQVDPTQPDSIKLFGSADAERTVLHFTRRSPVFGSCQGVLGSNVPCVNDTDCAADDSVCARTVCVGGTAHNELCSGDTECEDGECGHSLFEFRGRLEGDRGPILIPLLADTIPDEQGVCDSGSSAGALCPPTICGAGRCVGYQVGSNEPVPLEGIGGTSDLFVFVRDESIEADGNGLDLNGDGDATDSVLTIRDRKTGRPLPVVGGHPLPRAVARIHQPPFSYPAVSASDNIVAFMELEPLQGNCSISGDCDKNGDGDVFDTIIRVYRESGDDLTIEEVTAGMDIAADAEPVINKQSVVISDGLVLYRRPEWAGARQRTALVSRAHPSSSSYDGGSISGQNRNAISGDGRHVAFLSSSPRLITGDLSGSQGGFQDAFVRDLVKGDSAASEDLTTATTRISVAPNGDAGDQHTFSVSSISLDGRYVWFWSGAENLVPEDVLDGYVGDFSDPSSPKWDRDVFLYDRLHNSITRISVWAEPPNADSEGRGPGTRIDFGPAGQMSGDLRYIPWGTNRSGFPDPFNVLSYSNSCSTDIYLFDRQLGHSKIEVSVGIDAMDPTKLVEHSRCGSQDRTGVFSVSADGRFVSFVTPATNLDDTPSGSLYETSDVYVHDRDFDENGVFDEYDGDLSLKVRTTRISLTTNGEGIEFRSEADLRPISGDLSPDGRFVYFFSDFPYTADDQNGVVDTFVRDRDVDRNGIYDEPGKVLTTRLSVAPDGSELDGFTVGQVGGRYMGFMSQASNFVDDGRDEGGNCHYYMRDNLTGAVARVNLRGPYGSAGGDAIGTIGSCHNGNLQWNQPVATQVGNQVVWRTRANDLLDQSVDCPSYSSCDPGDDLDVYVRGADFADLIGSEAIRNGPNDRNGDGDILDNVLEVLDTKESDATPHVIAPADEVSVFEQHIVFLRPEGAGASGASSGIDLNNDGDAVDSVVQYWHPSLGSETVNLGCAASAVAVSETHIVALVSEAGESNDIDENGLLDSDEWIDLNGDGDAKDNVIHVLAIADLPSPELDPAPKDCWGLPWMIPGIAERVAVAASRVEISGSVVAFLASEPENRTDLNADGDIYGHDRVVGLYDALGQSLIPLQRTGADNAAVGVAAENFVLGERLLAVQASEIREGNTSLNGTGDSDALDDALLVFDYGKEGCRSSSPADDCFVSTGYAITPCRLEACDPRHPFRVSRYSVRFLSTEEDQGCTLDAHCGDARRCIAGACDLDGDGDSADIVVQQYHAITTTVQPIATIVDRAGDEEEDATGIGDVLRDPLEDGVRGTTAFTTPAGLCLEVTSTECTADPYCTCRDGFCVKTHGICITDQDCPPSVNCERRCLCTDEDCQSGDADCDPACSAVSAAAKCRRDSDCSAGSLCVGGFCEADLGACDTSADCPFPASCKSPVVLVAASADPDEDEIPDAFDICPDVFDPEQYDTDSDGIGDECDVSHDCVSLPVAGCATVPADKGSSLKVVNKARTDKKDLMKWKWSGTNALLEDFGTPLISTDFTLCLYEGPRSAATLRVKTRADRRGDCGGKPCWRVQGDRGFKYRDGLGSSDGVRSFVIKVAKNGNAKVRLKAKGELLANRPQGLNDLELPPPVPLTLQLQGSHGKCWEAVYNMPLVIGSEKLKANADN